MSIRLKTDHRRHGLFPAPNDGLAALAEPAVDSTPDIVDGVAIARLYGEPLFALPQDLYIPPTRSRYSSKRSRDRSTCCFT